MRLTIKGGLQSSKYGIRVEMATGKSTEQSTEPPIKEVQIALLE